MSSTSPEVTPTYSPTDKPTPSPTEASEPETTESPKIATTTTPDDTDDDADDDGEICGAPTDTFTQLGSMFGTTICDEKNIPMFQPQCQDEM